MILHSILNIPNLFLTIFQNCYVFSATRCVRGVWINKGVDGVMIVRVTPGGRLGMWMRGCRGVIVDVHVWGYYRDVAGDVAHMCS